MTEIVIARCAPLAAAKGIRFTLDITEHLPKIMMDEIRIEQVLSNLVGNAIKFSPNQSEIKISITRKDRQLKIAITDFGIGMTEAQILRAFDRYWQAPAFL